VALGVPLLNVFGQERSQWFWEHCGIVIGACLSVLLFFYLMRYALRIPNKNYASPGALPQRRGFKRAVRIKASKH
jgi:Na+/melibiose symporter-like transporter